MVGVAQKKKNLDIIKLEPLKTFTALSKPFVFDSVQFQLRSLFWGSQTHMESIQRLVHFTCDSKENYYSTLTRCSIFSGFKVCALWNTSRRW